MERMGTIWPPAVGLQKKNKAFFVRKTRFEIDYHSQQYNVRDFRERLDAFFNLLVDIER